LIAPAGLKARHHQHVAIAELVNGAAQLGAVGLRAARRFRQDLLGSGGAKLLHLSVNALAVGRDSRIAVNHGSIIHRIYATKKDEQRYCAIETAWRASQSDDSEQHCASAGRFQRRSGCRDQCSKEAHQRGHGQVHTGPTFPRGPDFLDLSASCSKRRLRMASGFCAVAALAPSSFDAWKAAQSIRPGDVLNAGKPSCDAGKV